MSAYVCDPEHIKALAIWAVKRGQGGGRRVEPGYLIYDGGQDMTGHSDEAIATYYATVLMAENVRSVNARYNEQDEAEPVEVTQRDLWKHHNFRPVDILKMCDGLEYQSCETEDYRQTPAYKLLQRIRKAAIRVLPDYEDSPCWHYTGQNVERERLNSRKEREATEAAYARFCD